MFKFIKLWIVGSAACVSIGWILSLLHRLNFTGYAVTFLFLGLLWIGVFVNWRQAGRMAPIQEGVRWPRWSRRRLRRPLPMLFLLTAIIAAIGGALHAPNNYDALTYRFPRLLNWWADSGWHWIATPNERMNLSGTDFEWLMMPLFVLTHSDRFFFLINVVAYLFMPSLVFATFTRCGVGRRVAWLWMWLLPAALCFAMQAGSISNDTIAATYFLSALYFAFQARRNGAVRNLWLSFLAAALFTGIKASNLPLLLPVAWAVWPALKLVKKRLVASVAVVLASILVSFLPTAALNLHFSGDWAGDPHNLEKNKVVKPLAGILGNGLQLGLQCLEPPFLPLARSAENWIWDHFPTTLQSFLRNDFPRFGVGFRELPQEESAGLGIIIATMAIISIVAMVRWRRRWQEPSVSPERCRGLMIGWLTWVALFAYMSKMGSESTSRLLSAYYPTLLLPFLASPAQDYLVRQVWYRRLGMCATIVALLGVILTPSRPLWPASEVFDWAVNRYPKNELLEHARMVYTVYRHRNDFFATLRRDIPDSVQVIGFISGGDDAETSLWRPYGARRVVFVLPGDRPREMNLKWVVVRNYVLEHNNPDGLNQWLSKNGGSVIATDTLIEKAGMGREKWSVVRIGDETKL